MENEEIKDHLIDIETVLMAQDDKLHKMLEANTKLKVRLDNIRKELNDRSINRAD